MFSVDVSRAGRGTLNLSITASGRDVKYDLKENTPGIYEVVYVPHTDHPHKIDVYYNGHQAPGNTLCAYFISYVIFHDMKIHRNVKGFFFLFIAL